MYILTLIKELPQGSHGTATFYYDKEAEMFVTEGKRASHLDLDEAMSIQATYKERGYPVKRELVENIL